MYDGDRGSGSKHTKCFKSEHGSLDYSQTWTVKCTDIYKQQQAKLYTVTILCYRQAVQNLHNVPSVGVHTHFSRTYCGLYYIFYSMYLKKLLDTFPFTWQTYVISNKQIFHCITKFSWSWQHYVLCGVYFSIMEHIKKSVHRFIKFSLASWFIIRFVNYSYCVVWSVSTLIIWWHC